MINTYVNFLNDAEDSLIFTGITSITFTIIFWVAGSGHKEHLLSFVSGANILYITLVPIIVLSAVIILRFKTSDLNSRGKRNLFWFCFYGVFCYGPGPGIVFTGLVILTSYNIIKNIKINTENIIDWFDKKISKY